MKADVFIAPATRVREVHDRTDDDRVIIAARVALYRARHLAGLDVITGLPRPRTGCGHPSEQRTRHADGRERCRACNRERSKIERAR